MPSGSKPLIDWICAVCNQGAIAGCSRIQVFLVSDERKRCDALSKLINQWVAWSILSWYLEMRLSPNSILALGMKSSRLAFPAGSASGDTRFDGGQESKVSRVISS